MFRVLITLVLLQIGCSPSSPFGSSGSSSSASSTSCSSADAPAPSSNYEGPVLFQMGKLKLDPKVISTEQATGSALVRSLFWSSTFDAKTTVLKKSTPLDLLYDQNCLAHGPVHDLRTFALRTQVEVREVREDLKVPWHVFEWEAPADLSIFKLAEMAERDPCLLEVSNALTVYPFVTPNDTQFSSQAHHTAIRSTTAWNTFFGATRGITTTTVIAIVDSGGEHAHADLLANRWTNTAETAGNATDDDGNGYVDDRYGFNFKNNIADPSPIAWTGGGEEHGTHVAGISAARYNNSVGVTGVMGQNIQIMHLNVFGDSGSGSTSNIVNGIYYAINNGAKIINMSLGGQGASSSYSTAMNAAVNAGVTVVVAAGNSNEQLTDSNWYSPASYGKAINGAITVGAVKSSDELRSSYSNYSSTFVEIGAPGNDSSSSGILATLTSGTYGRLQGTSMASPVVAGAAALVYGLLASRGFTPTPAIIESLLYESGEVKQGLSGFVKGCRTLDLATLATQINSTYP